MSDSEWNDEQMAEERRARLEAMWTRIAARLKRRAVCPVCDGCGAIYVASSMLRLCGVQSVEICPICGGSGSLLITPCERDG